GGEARIASSSGVGTTVSILLPEGDATHVESQIAAAASRTLPAQGGGRRIVIVEDDESVRQLTARLLEMAGYDCTPTGDVNRALALLRSEERIDLLLTDVGLPGMDGRELAELSRQIRPRLPVLLLTGYAPHSLALNDVVGNGVDMMKKPYEAEALLARVAQLMAGGVSASAS
ncbi:MAG: response regulator, partial [Lysobacter sp.]|nr:response regulator [Lysobacter sp.]